jgi:hypothetical protein
MAVERHPRDVDGSLSFRPRLCLTILAIAIGIVALASIVARLLLEFTSLSWANELNRLFDLDLEQNIPTLLASVLLSISALLLGAIFVFKQRSLDRYSRHWLILASIFIYLVIDEFTSIHELFVVPLREKFSLGGVFYLAWVILAIPIILVIGLLYTRFILSLPQHTRRLILAAAATYITGSLGMEMIGGQYQQQNGFDLIYAGMTTLEETLEMLGISLFIYALLDYLKSYQKEIQLRLDD